MALYSTRSVCIPCTRPASLFRRCSRICASSVKTSTVNEVKSLSYDVCEETLGEEMLIEEWDEREVQEVKTGAASWFRQCSSALSGFLDGTDKTQGLVLLNVMTFLMATNWVVVKDAEATLDPFTFSALRFAIATIAFIPFLGSTPVMDKKLVRAGVELGLWNAMGYLTQSIGLVTTDASRASFLSAFTVILVPILVGMSGKGVSRTTWGAAAVALLGTSMLEQGGGTPPGIGDVFNLLSAAFFAVQIFRTEHFSRRFPGQATGLLATSLTTTAALSAALAVGLHPSECLHFAQNLHTSNLPWKEIMYTGVLSTDVVLFIEMVALNNVSSTDAAIIYTMEPVLGALLAYFLLGERWGPIGWVGASLILISSLYTQLKNESEALNAAEGQ